MSESENYPVVQKVIGSPGSGKTTRVVGNPELGIQGLFLENSDEYSLEQQMLVTYTNAGVDEAAERLYKMTDFPKYKIEERVTTIHSRSYQLLDLDREQVVDHWKKQNFCKKFGLDFGFDDDEDDIMGADLDAGNALFRIYDWLQNNRKSLSDWQDCPVEWEWDDDPEYLMEEWVKHKKRNNYVGFGDMIQGVVEWGKEVLTDRGYGPLFNTEEASAMEVFKKANEQDFSADEFRGRGPFIDTKVLYVDEVQDLNPLQWSWYLLQKLVCEQVYIGGDDDQTIYGWSGANPEFMLNEEGEFEVLETTYRIPKEIWEVCDGVINQVDVRQDKKVQPDGEGGEFKIMRHPSKRQLMEELKEGEWMILFRARYQINNFTNEVLHEIGIPYRNMSTFDIWGDDVPKLRDALYKVENNQKQIKGDELHVLMEYADDSMILHDNDMNKTEKVMGQFGGIDINRLDNIFQLTRNGRNVRFDAKNFLELTDDINHYEKQAILGNIKSGNTDLDPERIRIGTIHSAKGKEAPNVLVATDSTPTIMDNMSQDLGIINSGRMGRPITDSERRVYYVGMTRASEKLILAEGVVNDDVYIDVDSILAEDAEPEKWEVGRSSRHYQY